MTLLTLLVTGASQVPPVSVIIFIVGAALWLLSFLWGRFGTPWAWDTNHGFGVSLMVFAIGLRVIFGV
jgi:hypothetical protein